MTKAYVAALLVLAAVAFGIHVELKHREKPVVTVYYTKDVEDDPLDSAPAAHHIHTYKHGFYRIPIKYRTSH